MSVLEHLTLLALILWCARLQYRLDHLRSLWRDQEFWLDWFELQERKQKDE